MSKFEIKYFNRDEFKKAIYKLHTTYIYADSIEEAEELFRKNINLILISIMEVIYETKGY